MTLISKELQQIIRVQIERLGYILWGIEVIPTRYSYLARIYIDKSDGVDIDDCALVNRTLNMCLRDENIGLEVSSPGIKRKIFESEQYQSYIGQHIKVKTKQPINGQKNFIGKLLATDEKSLFLAYQGEKKEFMHQHIEIGQLEPDYSELFKR